VSVGLAIVCEHTSVAEWAHSRTEDGGIFITVPWEHDNEISVCVWDVSGPWYCFRRCFKTKQGKNIKAHRILFEKSKGRRPLGDAREDEGVY